MTVLALVSLASEAARSQDIGPGPVTSTISLGSSRTVLGSTQWMPPSGSVAANVGGPGTLTFGPTAGNNPGPITVSTQNASAIVISGSGQLVINPSGTSFTTTITTTGTNAYAINVTSGQHAEPLNNVFITTSGVNSDGIRIENPNNTVNATDVRVTTTGVGASALALISGGGSTANFANSTLTSEAGPVIRVRGGSNKSINLTGTSVTAGGSDGRWLYVTGGTSNTNITASHSTLTGAAITDSGSTSNLTLTNGTRWDMTGTSNVTNLINNASQIDFAAGSAFKTLTTVNYAGVGGTIGLNTFLGTDSSPSDLLVINGGSATGSSFLRITNAGGPGVQTTGNGILVVEAINNGTTQAGAFTLAGEARGGAIDYFLFRGGLNGSAPDNWFLRSSFNGGNGGDGNGNGDSGNGPVTPPGVLPPEALPEDLPPVLPPGVYPIIGPEIATYGAVQPTALSTLGTLHERIGDTLPIANAGSGGGWARSGWARGFGEQINNRYRAFADPRTDGQLAGFQSGIDLWRGSFLPAHRDLAGVYFAYANANVDATGLVTNEAATNYVQRKTGSLNLNGWSGGAYWTHYGPTGWYLDAVLQATAYEGTASTTFASLSTNGVGFVSSLEAGYPIALPALGPGFVLEPQGQIVWQHVSFGDANDGLGDVALGSTSGASGRLGLRGRWTIVSDGGQVWQPYVRANLWKDWGAQATTTFSGVDRVPLLEQATRLYLAAG
ncbi:autotransporter outer membrane beta-barrel domain-containing protein [Bradyrhizobium sp. SSUT112]|uniref:autotransporter family protein n=1 Tax=Bradyrhizobium sp. SSUT112 TaxID=3040604 RepID=UPI00244B3721|nr:autotransporter outer membrane beta-barrel domain-containing protein [Bradyrhizobium sp. SSUT112]MDH2350261.1 autotransporter outer membrane beta-barrel domain-containing protein [Bradyrhizobium sp. SSUT112]